MREIRDKAKPSYPKMLKNMDFIIGVGMRSDEEQWSYKCMRMADQVHTDTCNQRPSLP